MSPVQTEERQAAGEAPLKSYRTILQQEIRQAEEELERPAKGLFVSGLLAGLGVGVSLFLMAVLLTLAGGAWPEPVTSLLVANAFTVGFIIVILGRTDLFTEYTTLAILPVLTGRSSIASLARLWGWVYLANVLGAAAFALLVVSLGPALEVVGPGVLGGLAREPVRHGAWVIFQSALLAGWLMGLLSWLVTAGRDTISQVFFVWLVTFSIGLGNLHHAITGSAEVLAGVFAGEGAGWPDFGRFLFWTTLGNAAGGVVFAVLIRYSLVIRQTDEPDRSASGNGGHPRSGEGPHSRGGRR